MCTGGAAGVRPGGHIHGPPLRLTNPTLSTESVALEMTVFSPVGALSDSHLPDPMQHVRNRCAENPYIPRVSSDRVASRQERTLELRGQPNWMSVGADRAAELWPLVGKTTWGATLVIPEQTSGEPFTEFVADVGGPFPMPPIVRRPRLMPTSHP